MKKRHWFVILIIIILFIAVIGRLIFLHLIDQEFLATQGNHRSLRTQIIPAKRGMILDRDGRPLAISTAVDTIWVNPSKLDQENPKWQKIVALLGLNLTQVDSKIAKRKSKQFMYLKRQIPPALSAQIEQLHVMGVYHSKAYRRFYPTGEVLAPVLGFTNIDGRGQEGLELQYNTWLSGQPGKRQIRRDLLGQITTVLDKKPPHPGKNLTLSIDQRMQYITYHDLKAAMVKNRAMAASAVILNVHTGEVLAMVSLPSFNPNSRQSIQPGAMRNRTVTDVFEPGSTIKPFAMTAVLESGQYPLDATINTSPGYTRIGRHIVRDTHNNGTLSLTGVLQKSSNVGISRLTLSLKPQIFPQLLGQFGFGHKPKLIFPGVISGYLPQRRQWPDFALATLTFGYGLSATTLQLAHAYAILGNEGRSLPVTLLKRQQTASGVQVVKPQVAKDIVKMLQSVVGKGGTATRAQVKGFLVAGKTGTTRKAIAGGYADNSYIAIFAGLIPADNPQLAMVIMVDDPRADRYYGGSVSAPVFSQVMHQIMPLLD